MHAVGRYALAAETVIQGAGMNDVGDFAVAIAFPRRIKISGGGCGFEQSKIIRHSWIVERDCGTD